VGLEIFELFCRGTSLVTTNWNERFSTVVIHAPNVTGYYFLSLNFKNGSAPSFEEDAEMVR
jgi:hypothetical protein